MSHKDFNQRSLADSLVTDHKALHDFDDIDKLINWQKIKEQLAGIHDKKCGNSAYPPLLRMGFATVYTAAGDGTRSQAKKIFVGGKAPKPPSRFNEVKMQDLIESSGEAETDIEVAVTGGVPVAVSRAEVARIVDPRAAAQNTPRAVT